MNISKPETPEELYKFFIKGMPLKRTRRGYRYDFKRKGWNVFTHFIKFQDTNEAIRLDFYTVINSYHPDWKLNAFKYVDTETN